MERFIKVEDGVWILDPAIGADSMAVIGAMMSRAPDLGRKFEEVAGTSIHDARADTRRLVESLLADLGVDWKARGEEVDKEIEIAAARIVSGLDQDRWNFQAPPARVKAFLEQNVAGYGHASIASMAKAVFLYLSGFGWPAAWLLEDTPLFDGQEVSTRAVDAEEIAGADGPGSIARYAHPSLARIHEGWMNLYKVQRDKATGKGWKYDDARVFLPGTIPTGVVWTNDVRTIARHMDHIKGMGGWGAELAAQGYAGLAAAAPVTTKAIGHKNRSALKQWTVTNMEVDEGLLECLKEGPAAGMHLFQWDEQKDPEVWDGMLEHTEARGGAGRHLDPLWAMTPRFAIEIHCSIAVARDWHRHRPVMPWTLEVTRHKGSGIVAMAPWYGIEAEAGEELLAETTKAYDGILKEDPTLAGQWAALHALPFGTMVVLSALCTLPALVYMLELRARTSGASPEYKAQAIEGIRQLCALLPKNVVEREGLDQTLEENETADGAGKTSTSTKDVPDTT